VGAAHHPLLNREVVFWTAPKMQAGGYADVLVYFKRPDRREKKGCYITAAARG